MNSKLEKIRELNQQAWDLCKKDGPQALHLAQRAQGLLAECAEAQATDEFDCLKTQTYCLDMLSKQEQALPMGLRANQLAQQIGDKYRIGLIQSLLGRIYWHIDDYATSMDYYLNALKLVQTEHHPDLEISLINGLGMVQYGLENYTESLGYFKACLEKAGQEDLTGRADANNNIAYVLHMLGRDREAVEYAETALDMFNQMGAYVGRLHTLHSLGAIYLALRKYDQAMTCLQEGLELSRQNNSQLLELTYISEISRIHRVWGRYDQAEQELLLALQVAEKINSLTNISLIHERLIEIYKEKQDYRSALEHFEAFHEVYKKIFNDKSDRRIKNLEILNQVETARQQTELYRELAGTDSLTNLINRRHFLEIAENAVQHLKISREHLALIMLDIDHYKSVNDKYGHKAGDDILTMVAAIIKRSLRKGDIAGRYGGDEFLVLVSGASADHCFKIAERIRQAVARQEFQIGPVAMPVTISLGVVSIDPERVPPLDELINCADRALYLAKEQGRNRVVVWREGDQALHS
ncbi:MAG TPA: diguanylate cyclase [Anaerolineales bacterium]|nr:diguanylate cyclase [Anaerolineales bacterium]